MTFPLRLARKDQKGCSCYCTCSANLLGSPALLKTFHEPQVDQSFRQNTPCMGLGLNLSIHIGVKRNAPSTLCPDFGCHLVGLVPIVSQAVCIPEVSDLFQTAGFGNAGAWGVLRLVHTVSVP